MSPNEGFSWVCVTSNPVGGQRGTHSIAKAADCSLKTDSKTLLLKTSATQLTGHGAVKLVPTLSTQSHVLVFMGLEGTLHAAKKEKQPSTQLHTLQPTIVARSLWDQPTKM